MDITVPVGSEEQLKLSRVIEANSCFKLLDNFYTIKDTYHNGSMASPEITYFLTKL